SKILLFRQRGPYAPTGNNSTGREGGKHQDHQSFAARSRKRQNINRRFLVLSRGGRSVHSHKGTTVVEGLLLGSLAAKFTQCRQDVNRKERVHRPDFVQAVAPRLVFPSADSGAWVIHTKRYGFADHTGPA